MKEKILEKLNELRESYDMWLEALDNEKEMSCVNIEARLHDLKIQIWLLEDLLEECDKNARA